MDTKLTRAILEALLLFEKAYNREPLEKKRAMVVAATWATVLQGVTAEQVRLAAPVVLRHHRYGFPTPAALYEAVVGRRVRVPEFAQDLYGGRQRDSRGALVVDRWHELRVPLDWSGDPGALDFTELPAELRQHQIDTEQTQRVALPSNPEEPEEGIAT